MTEVDEREKKPGIDERLAQATNSSNLVATRMNDGDCHMGALEVLTAAGWSSRTTEYVLGRALIALESEWDGAEQPRVPREHDIELLASVMPKFAKDASGAPVLDSKGNPVEATARERRRLAQAHAEEWYETERARLIGRLRTLPMARKALAQWAVEHSIRHPEAKALAMLAWWLDHRCPKCLGTKLDPVPLGGRSAARVCKQCQGSGERPLPYDAQKDGRWISQDGRILERAMIDSRRRAMQKISSFTARSHRH